MLPLFLTYAPVFYPLCGTYHEMQGFGGSTYRPSYRHPGVATCSLGNPGPILGSAATALEPRVRPLVGHFRPSSQSTEREPQESACSTGQTNCCSTTVQRELDRINMYTSSKRQHVNAFASRLSGWFPRLFCKIRIARLSDLTNRDINNTRRPEVAF